MLDEKYGQEPGSEEEEYHFTDEQSGYEMSPEHQTASSQTAAPAAGLASRFQERRRIIIGIVVFLLLAGVVYRLIVPSKPAGDIAKELPAHTQTASQPARQGTAQGVSQTASAIQAPQAPAMATASAVPASAPGTSPVTASGQLPAAQAASSAPAGNAPTQPVFPSGVSGQPNDALLRALSVRMDSLEQQNTALMDTLQRQNGRSSADAEDLLALRRQVTQLREEVSQVTQAFHQLAVLLKARQGEENGEGAATLSHGQSGKTAARRSLHVGYFVQAIIPGRAWLRSVQGETVTVAEGDILSTVGRVTRIDPYDGTVTLVGNRGTVTLTYGQGEDE